MHVGSSGPATAPRSGPETPPPPLITGSVGVKPTGASQDGLRFLVLGKRVRLEFDDGAKKEGPRRARTCSWKMTRW